MDKFKTIFIVLGIILLFFLGKQCGNTSKTDFKPNTDTLIVHKVDTIRDTTTVFKIKEKTVFKYITLDTPIDTSKYSDINKYRLYQDTLRDINIVIFNHDTVLGYLAHRSLSYKLLVPLKIYDSTTITITKEIPKLPKYQVKVGLNVTTKGLYPNLDLTIKRSTYTAAYDPFNKIPMVGYKYTIWYK